MQITAFVLYMELLIQILHSHLWFSNLCPFVKNAFYFCFIVYTKVFGTIQRLSIMLLISYPGKLLSVIKSMYSMSGHVWMLVVLTPNIYQWRWFNAMWNHMHRMYHMLMTCYYSQTLSLVCKKKNAWYFFYVHLEMV